MIRSLLERNAIEALNNLFNDSRGFKDPNSFDNKTDFSNFIK